MLRDRNKQNDREEKWKNTIEITSEADESLSATNKNVKGGGTLGTMTSPRESQNGGRKCNSSGGSTRTTRRTIRTSLTRKQTARDPQEVCLPRLGILAIKTTHSLRQYSQGQRL